MTRARIPLALGLSSVAVIAFQLVVMQLLAIAQWHHFAYMVISMALLGFGAAGTVLVLLRDFIERHHAIVLPASLLACAVGMATTSRLAGIAGQFDAFLLFFDAEQYALLAFTYLVHCLPFFFAGLAITLVFCRETERIGTLYFANMVGSGAGAILIIALLWMLPASRLAGLLALLPLFAAWLVRPARGLHPAVWPVALIIPLLATMFPQAPASSQYKDIHAALQLPGARVVHRSSSPHGLLEVVSADAQRFAPSPSLHFRGEPPQRDVVFNDGEYLGTLLGRGIGEQGHILDHTTRALPYHLRRPDSVLVLMAATGVDVSHALSHGVSRVDAVEPHRHLNQLLRTRHPEWVDGLYRRPEVSLHDSGVRAFLGQHHGPGHDLIVLPVLGAFGGTSGVDALAEQYHLTMEAFRAMWDALGDDGMIAVTLWPEQPPRISLKLLASWRQLLDDHGVDEPVAHVAAVRSWGTATLLLGKSPFHATDRQRLRDFSREMGFDPLILADLASGERDHFNRVADPSWFAAIDALLAGDPAKPGRGQPFDIAPATDDRPFFSRFMQWRGLAELRETYGSRELPYLELGFVLAVVTLLQIVPASLVLIVLPLLRIGWSGTRRVWTLIYFSATGLGFMFFEIVLIQKLMLYLDQPVYSAAVVLAILLVSSGAGSLLSSRMRASAPVVAGTALLVAVLIVLCAFTARPVLDATWGWAPAAKVAAATLLLAPPGLFMGMLFPLGLRRLRGIHAPQIPWACAIDSCLSVSATALATLIALDTGFLAVLLMAAAAYALVALAGPRLGGDPASH